MLTRKFLKVARRSLYVYLILRSFAPLICRYVLLEEGFSFLKTLSKHKTEKHCIVDVGANDGTSINMIRQFYPDVQIYAFDPISQPLEKKGVTFINSALGSQEGEVILFTPVLRDKFNLTQYSSTERLNVLNQIEADFSLKRQSIKIKETNQSITRLDNFYLVPFFIKIDVEGHELQVLLGARETIKSSRPVLLVEINSADRFLAITDFLKAFNYLCMIQYKRNSYKACSVWQPMVNNYIFTAGNYNI